MKKPHTENLAATGRPAKKNRQGPAGEQAMSAAPAGEVNADCVQEDVIRAQAYALYEARGRTDGHALDDWLQAQQQIGQVPGRAADIGQPSPA